MPRVSKQELIDLYKTRTDAEIGKLFGITGRSVMDWRKHYGIPRTPKGEYNKYTLDHDFFAEIDTQEKAYALGLLSADGWVAKNGKQVSIGLQVKDEHILHDLQRVMRSNGRIFDKARGGFVGSTPRKMITFDSKKLCTDLARWGVIPGKSVTLTYPTLPANLECHYARGLLDGDGHIRGHQGKAFYFLGTLDLMNGLRKAILSHTGIVLTQREAQGCWRLSGYGGSAAVLHWMYRDATIFLRRKYQVYLDYWK